MKVKYPCLLVLCGPSGTGKSTWAEQFPLSYTVSSDEIRYILTDDENNQYANSEVFDLFYTIIRKRLLLGRVTIADSTALDKRTRDELLKIAKETNVPAYLVLADTPIEKTLENNSGRARQVPESTIRKQFDQFNNLSTSDDWAGIFSMQDVEFDMPYSITIPEPYYVIADVHGMYDKMIALNNKIPFGAPRIYTGDIVDRGPDTKKCINHIMPQVQAGYGFCVQGNHDNKLLRALKGNKIEWNDDIRRSYDELNLPIKQDYIDFLESLPPYLIVNNNVIVTHAGIKDSMIGSADKHTRDFCLYGKFIGTDENGKVLRQDWAQDYYGSRTIIYGHTVVPEVRFLNNTICVDTGACFGGMLSAIEMPSREVIQV